ncbi:hypothetical protein MRX96_035174 [Rhipicephalus microplus]
MLQSDGYRYTCKLRGKRAERFARGHILWQWIKRKRPLERTASPKKHLGANQLAPGRREKQRALMQSCFAMRSKKLQIEKRGRQQQQERREVTHGEPPPSITTPLGLQGFSRGGNPLPRYAREIEVVAATLGVARLAVIPRNLTRTE